MALPRIVPASAFNALIARVATLEASGGSGGGSGQAVPVPGAVRGGQIAFGADVGAGSSFDDAVGGIMPARIVVPANGTKLVPFVFGNDNAGYQWIAETYDQYLLQKSGRPLLRPGKSAVRAASTNQPITDSTAYVANAADRVATKAVLSPLNEANVDGNVRKWGDMTHVRVGLKVRTVPGFKEQDGTYVGGPVAPGALRASVFLSNSQSSAAYRRSCAIDRQPIGGSGAEDLSFVVGLSGLADDATMYFEALLHNTTGQDILVAGAAPTGYFSALSVNLFRYA